MSGDTTVSVIVPVFNGALHLAQCLEALRHSGLQPREFIVVDDCSDDDSAAIARAAGATVLETKVRSGPAAARNLGADAATGGVLLFIDADVRVSFDTIGLIRNRFERDSSLDAVIGSYDDEPSAGGLVSQYKNLLHHYMHQHGRPEAETFWSGCGACRRSVFLAAGGFNESYRRPCIEDIELGNRLRRGGWRIALDPAIQARHLKRYGFWGMLRSDIFDRAIPWTMLILETRHIPNDLNLTTSQRVGAVLAGIAGPLILVRGESPGALLVGAGLIGAAIILNRRFFLFLARKRGWIFAAAAVPLHVLYYLYSVTAFAAGSIAFLAQKLAGTERAGAPKTKPATR